MNQQILKIDDAFEKVSESIKEAFRDKDRPHWRDIARPEQLFPESVGVCPCTEWLFLAGRGSGKTRAAAERLRERILSGQARYISLIGQRLVDVRDVMVEGESGLLSVMDYGMVEKYNRSIGTGEILFRGGAKARFFSGEDPDALRGWQSTDIWGDELFSWAYPDAVYDMAMFGFRLGKPEAIWTSTPKPVPLIKKLLKRADEQGNLGSIRYTKSSTYANEPNLAPAFFSAIVKGYEGTRLGRQELEAEVLEDIEGALWQRSWIDATRLTGKWQDLGIVKIVIGVDPSVSDPEKRNNPNKEPDACGIIVVGMDENCKGYVLADLSGVYSPNQWARVVSQAHSLFNANLIVAEKNQGGQMVEDTLRAFSSGAAIRLVSASQGKRVRAEPVSALYEQGRVSHVGRFDLLEDELCGWDATNPRAKSPNRLDALVWAFHGMGLASVTGSRMLSRFQLMEDDDDW